MEVGFRGFLIVLLVVSAFLAAGLGIGVSQMAALGVSKVRGAKVTIGESTVIRAEVVKSAAARAKGLSGRKSLSEGAGMLFVTEKPERQVFWMKGMRLSIDIIWVRDGVVVGIEEKVPLPPSETPDISLKRYPSPGPVSMVLEVQSGFAEKHGIKPGDAVMVAD